MKAEGRVPSLFEGIHAQATAALTSHTLSSFILLQPQANEAGMLWLHSFIQQMFSEQI